MNQSEILHGLISLLAFKAGYQQESSGLKPQDLHLLEHLAEHEAVGVPTLELSRRYGISPATVIAMLDRLQSEGMVQRKRSAQDKRVVEVSLTKRGQQVIQQHLAEDQTFSKNLFATLPPNESEQLQQLLSKLLSSVDRDVLFTD